MSDEPPKQHIELPHTPAGIHEHWCEHPGCKRWGSFGLPQPDKSTRWYCGEHRDAPSA